MKEEEEDCCSVLKTVADEKKFQAGLPGLSYTFFCQQRLGHTLSLFVYYSGHKLGVWWLIAVLGRRSLVDVDHSAWYPHD